jgi:tRNA-2-methylthio-N6-dimethylallyladenosine synthase
MNKADSERLAGALEHLGMESVSNPRDADVVVLNSCVVRQSAENRVIGTLGHMKSVKRDRKGQIVALMGCMVGANTKDLAKRFPYVDVFMKPQEFRPLLEVIADRTGIDVEGCLSNLVPAHPTICSFVSVIHGCDLMCTFCIIPFRRGRQISRPLDEIVSEVGSMVERGMKEVTLLGQTVDAYGHDLEEKVDLADLLRDVSNVKKIKRVRFLTSHPNFMSQRILDTVRDAELVCEHINLPVQAGDDQILRAMRRRYTEREYREMIDNVRKSIPGVAITTDIIVGFPGETRNQFKKSRDLIADLEFDKVHIAAYSTRPGTYAQRNLTDDVCLEEKKERLRELEELQKIVSTRNNAKLSGQVLEVLVDGVKDGQWRGRTRTDKLAFFTDTRDLIGQVVKIKVDRSSPWSLGGVVCK